MLRGDKLEGISREALRDVWWDRLDDDERQTLDRLSGFDPDDDPNNGVKRRAVLAENYLDYAINHQLERQSVIPLTRLKETALREGFGQITSDDLEAALSRRDDLIQVEKNGRTFATTKQVLEEERTIIDFTYAGYGTQRKLNANYEIGEVTDHENNVSFELTDEQKSAVNNLLESRHRIQAVQGKAGVGKTTMMASLIEGIEEGGGAAAILAPTADAAYDTLRCDGEKYRNDTMQNAQTLAKLFQSEKLMEENRGKTLIVDEAGLMSVHDMHSLFAVANKFDNRIILVGDTAQHNSVTRGDAFHILQEEADLETLALENIRRQKGQYKIAVSDISKGDVVKGFDRLDKMEAITEEGDDEARYRRLADKYAEYVEKQESTLTVAPTHAEGKKATEAIREALKKSGQIKKKEATTTRYRNLQLSEAERGSRHKFKAGQMVRFQQNTKGNIKRGSQFSVSKVDKQHVWVTDKQGNESKLDLSQSSRFSVYENQAISLASGDSIRITEGGKSKDGKRLINGSIYKVDKVLNNGDVKLTNGRVLDADQGNINYGYVTTSYASQGKTVQHVLIAQSTESGGASSAEQFYVSTSRGKKSVEIFTDDKEELRNQIQRSHQRLSATELTKNQPSISKAKQQEIQRIIATREFERRLRMARVNPSHPANQQWQDRLRSSSDRGLSRE
ncbi:MAG: AAA family ATPase [Candidatus Thiodiazotropha sp. (ex Semelilucina semeliformis)]|nr:AAA family ATPase [Candidatus Thiodiazotropha sp. (ex Semelilucina semeliformis)]